MLCMYVCQILCAQPASFLINLPTSLVIFLGRSQVPVKCPKHLDVPLGAPGKKCPLISHIGFASGLISIGRGRVGDQRGTSKLPSRRGDDASLNCKFSKIYLFTSRFFSIRVRRDHSFPLATILSFPSTYVNIFIHISLGRADVLSLFAHTRLFNNNKRCHFDNTFYFGNYVVK